MLRQKRGVRTLAIVVVVLFCLFLGLRKIGNGISLVSLASNAYVPSSALVSLVKQRDQANIVEMVRNVEDRFNHRFNHDWVFLSEEEFKPEFKKIVSAYVSGNVDFRTINRKMHWMMPGHIDRNRMSNAVRNLDTLGVPYGGSTTYRLMCQFQTGYFMEYLPEYRYYARIDPDVRLYCDVTEDFFMQMYTQRKKYAFTISLHEVPHTTHELSPTINQFMKTHKEIVHENQWLDRFIHPWENYCHFWSNFEVADLEFYRSEEYRAFFQFIHENGGIFYHRWGDAPLHSAALALFTDPSEVMWLSNVGMSHNPNMNCPPSLDEQLKLKCAFPASQQVFTYKQASCTPHFLNLTGQPFQEGWESQADAVVVNQFREILSTVG